MRGRPCRVLYVQHDRSSKTCLFHVADIFTDACFEEKARPRLLILRLPSLFNNCNTTGAYFVLKTMQT